MKKYGLFLLFLMCVGFVQATPEYKVGQKFGTKDFTAPIAYLAEYKGDIYALEQDGFLRIFDADSCLLKGGFDTGMENTKALAISPEGEIFTFSTIVKRTPKIIKNRKYMLMTYEGVTCKVFNTKGKELRTMKLKDLKSATAARVIDGKLLVADQYQHILFVLKPKNGGTVREKKGFRLCCGLFDFCEGPDDTYAVANLGAFKVQQYNLHGKELNAFGKRGRGLDDFHGCCNPVSLGYLPDASLVTVEKDPTRVKIYDPDGKHAQKIDGLKELVKGCSYIPVAIDKQGNIFLAASTKKYIVKCVPKK
jgi:hypothetical protein